MKRMIFKKADSFQTCKPGEWCFLDGGVYGRSPNGCGAAFRLTGYQDPARNWEIHSDGTVHPSVNLTLPEDAAFHEFITLEGWTPEDAANAR